MHPLSCSKRVLVADDYPGAAKSLADLLAVVSVSPIETSFVLNGALAVDHTLANRPAVAILDIEMPIMDGVQAAASIRAKLGVDAPLLIALTANAGRAQNKETLRVFDHVFSKPADIDKLLVLLALPGT